MSDATNNNLFGSGLTSINEVFRHIVFKLDYIVFFVPMLIQYSVCDVKFSVPVSSLMKGLHWNFFSTVQYMLDLANESRI